MSEVTIAVIWIIVTMTPAGYAPQTTYFTSAEDCHKEVERQIQELREFEQKFNRHEPVTYSCVALIPMERQ